MDIKSTYSTLIIYEPILSMNKPTINTQQISSSQVTYFLILNLFSMGQMTVYTVLLNIYTFLHICVIKAKKMSLNDSTLLLFQKNDHVKNIFEVGEKFSIGTI